MNPFADAPTPPAPTGKTFDEWSRLGYRIYYGAKATGRNADGIPTFTDDQVHWVDDDFEEDIGRGPDHSDPGPLNRF